MRVIEIMKWFWIIFAAVIYSANSAAEAAEVVIFDGHTMADVVHVDHDAGRTLELAAGLLSRDLQDLSGRAPKIARGISRCENFCIVVGLYSAPEVRRLARLSKTDLSDLKGQWEVYRRFVVRSGDVTYLVIAGSDRRGAVYGTVDLSRTLGISPWEWWADVTPRRQNRLSVYDATITSKTPSVKYRGVFLNDEDWGLEPWAAKTYDPTAGNIGPKTYARVFELLWRLKADTLWPAMHSVSKPFYSDLQNPELASDYSIVIGTSHAEPMMRNNLREWDEDKRGPFDFTRNGKSILEYWRDRAASLKDYENIYTVGLRGIHDGPMQGAASVNQRQAILKDVIVKQRDILTQVYKKPAQDVPQVFIAYHELQEAYDAGLTLPDDVTLMWSDDNYGYIRRLSNAQEQRRSGGAGVYYHISYWGRPHDYLWLATTHPALLREEMDRAWSTNARRIWMVNVGDIKPGEILTQYFLDLAFDADRLKLSPREYLTRSMGEMFGKGEATDIAQILIDYYDLAWSRKPEFMGFGQTEWVSQNRHTGFIEGDGEEAQARIAAYQQLSQRTEAVADRLPADRRDSFFELVLYPVQAAAALNTRILKLDLADLYAEQGRASANLYVKEAKAANESLVQDTAIYNSLQNGKWRGMMDSAPRGLPVFQEPLWPTWSMSKTRGCSVAVSGQWINDNNTLTFVAGRPQERSLTLFGYRSDEVEWNQVAIASGLHLSVSSGTLDVKNRYEQRMHLRYDGKVGPGDQKVILRCDGQKLVVNTQILPPLPVQMPVEDNRIVTLKASDATMTGDWELVDGLGSLGNSLRSRLDMQIRTPGRLENVPSASYSFATSTDAGGVLKVFALPTHSMLPNGGQRVEVQLDDADPELVDFSTTGRSDEWRRNVLKNSALREMTMAKLSPGIHVLKLYGIDPGVIVDHIEVDLDGAMPHYGPAEVSSPAS